MSESCLPSTEEIFRDILKRCSVSVQENKCFDQAILTKLCKYTKPQKLYILNVLNLCYTDYIISTIMSQMNGYIYYKYFIAHLTPFPIRKKMERM